MISFSFRGVLKLRVMALLAEDRARMAGTVAVSHDLGVPICVELGGGWWWGSSVGCASVGV